MIIIFMALQLIETIYHSIQIEIYDKHPNKFWSVVRRCVAAALVMYFLEPKTERPLGVVLLAYLVNSWWIHNYVLNLMRNFWQYLENVPHYRKIWYLNKHSWPDRHLLSYQPYIFYLSTIAAFTLLGMYFFN
jgi:hypothetical protein